MSSHNQYDKHEVDLPHICLETEFAMISDLVMGK